MWVLGSLCPLAKGFGPTCSCTPSSTDMAAPWIPRHSGSRDSEAQHSWYQGGLWKIAFHGRGQSRKHENFANSTRASRANLPWGQLHPASLPDRSLARPHSSSRCGPARAFAGRRSAGPRPPPSCSKAWNPEPPGQFLAPTTLPARARSVRSPPIPMSSRSVCERGLLQQVREAADRPSSTSLLSASKGAEGRRPAIAPPHVAAGCLTSASGP